MKACAWWTPRWYWNLTQTWRFISYHAARLWMERVRIPIGGLRKPVYVRWVDAIGPLGEIIPHGEPECPYCGEMPYSLRQCCFCGQRFIYEGGEG